MPLTAGGLPYPLASEPVTLGADNIRDLALAIDAKDLVGTHAARPAANTVKVGTRYFSTDALGLWRSDGANWVLVAQGAPYITPAMLSQAPWTTPYDGMRVRVQVDASQGIGWLFRYSAGSSNADKWEFDGGPPMYAVASTFGGLTADGTYKNYSLGLTAPRPGIYYVRYKGDYMVTTAGGSIYANLARGTGSVIPIGEIGSQGGTGAQNGYGGLHLWSRIQAQSAGQGLYEILNTAAVGSSIGQRYFELLPIRIS